MARSRSLKDLLGCCFGSASQDANKQGNHNGIQGVSTSKDANKDVNDNISQRGSNNKIRHQIDDNEYQTNRMDDGKVVATRVDNFKIDDNKDDQSKAENGKANRHTSDSRSGKKDDNDELPYSCNVNTNNGNNGDNSDNGDLDAMNRVVDTSNVDYNLVSSTGGQRDDNDDDNGNTIDDHYEDGKTDEHEYVNSKDHGNNDDNTSDEDNVGKVENPDPHFCETCRKIDFDSLFTEQNCSTRPFSTHPFFSKVSDGLVLDWYPDCGCLTEEASEQGWGASPLPRTLDSAQAACCVCTFLNEAQNRLGYLQDEEEDWEDEDAFSETEAQGAFLADDDELIEDGLFKVKAFHSLHRFRIWTHRSNRNFGADIIRGTHRDNGGDEVVRVDASRSDDNDDNDVFVQDIAALQIVGGGEIAGLWASTLVKHHAILRAIDDGHRTLTRAKGAGGGIMARKLDPLGPNYDLISDWLKLCRSTHARCHAVLAAEDIPGFQVIDCATGQIVPFASTATRTGEGQEYVTLSYVWGTGSFEGPVHRWGNGNVACGLFLPDRLPLSISDTMQVIKRLGFRYLWIDRYCIPQEDAPAKQMQIQNMGRIYFNSALTVIAAAGDGPEYGLPGVSSRARQEQLSVQVTTDISLVLYEEPKRFILGSKWNTRGWTYQEGHLSKRRLAFTDHMVYFQCQEMQGDEVLSLPVPGLGEDFDETRVLSFNQFLLADRLVFPEVMDWTDTGTIWERIIEFSQRDLGFEGDTINAISGILEMYVQAETGSKVALFCGLPLIPSVAHHNNEETKGKQLVCSFRELWEHEGPEEPGVWTHVRDDNATYQLMRSLLWNDASDDLDDMLVPNMLVPDSLRVKPTSLDHMRRPMFPSWTWAGWKTYQPSNDAIDTWGFALDSRTTIGVQYESMPLLDWEHDNEQIHNLSRQGKIPSCLRIRGIVLDMKLTWHSHKHKRKQGGSWIYKTPLFLRGEPLADSAPRFLLERAGSGKQNEIQVLGLIMAGVLRYGCFNTLILLPVTKMLDGQPRAMFERAHHTSLRLKRSQDEWRKLARVVREMDVLLC